MKPIAPSCPKCGGPLQYRVGDAGVPLSHYVVLELAGCAVFGWVLWALWPFAIGLVFAIPAAFVAVALLSWFLAKRTRARDAEQYSCASCMRVFGAWRLRSLKSSQGPHAL